VHSHIAESQMTRDVVMLSNGRCLCVAIDNRSRSWHSRTSERTQREEIGHVTTNAHEHARDVPDCKIDQLLEQRLNTHQKCHHRATATLASQLSQSNTVQQSNGASHTSPLHPCMSNTL